MCKLQELHYACGHTRKVLLEACRTVSLLGPVPRNRAPAFCLNGLNVVQDSTTEADCGRGQDGLTCREFQAVEPLNKRFGEMTVEFAGFEKRAAHIEAIVRLGLRPDCDWQETAKEGFSIKEFQEKQEHTLTNVIPSLLERFAALLKRNNGELGQAYRLNRDQIVAKLNGMDMDIPPGAVPCGVNLRVAAAQLNGEINEDLLILEAVYKQLREEVHKDLVTLEECAFDGCLDDVGWNLPDDDEVRAEYLYLMSWRPVQPLKKRYSYARCI